MDFDIFNHQVDSKLTKIMYKLGGIEAQKNQSLESLENLQSRIFEGMKNAQKAYKKIYEAVFTVKQNLQSLRDNYLSLRKESKHPGKLLNLVQNEMMGSDALFFSKKMQEKAQQYAPNLKKLKQKYTVCADSLEHYRQKIVILRKNIEKQSLANVTQDEHSRFQRNRDKLKKAEDDHDTMLEKITKRFADFNVQGIEDIYFDLLNFMSGIGSQMIKVSTKLSNYLYQNFSTTEIVLARQIQNKKKTKVQEKSHNLLEMSKNTQNMNSTEEGQVDSKKVWLDHLIESQQISNSLKAMMDHQIAKIEPSLSLQHFFHKKEPNLKEHIPAKEFQKFKNIYNTPHQRHKNETALEKVKEPDVNSACEDLIEVQELSGNSPQGSIGSVEEVEQTEIEMPEIRQRDRKLSIHEQKIKKNLQIFHQMCQKNTIPSQKQKQQQHPAQVIKNNHRIVEKKQKTVNAGDFFNMFMSTPLKDDQNQIKTHKKLENLHEHSNNRLQEVDFFGERTPKLGQITHVQQLSQFKSQSASGKITKLKKQSQTNSRPINLLDL